MQRMLVWVVEEASMELFIELPDTINYKLNAERYNEESIEDTRSLGVERDRMEVSLQHDRPVATGQAVITDACKLSTHVKSKHNIYYVFN